MLILSKVILFLTFSEFFLGIWINGFIWLLYCITWVRNRKISLSDFIILNLTLSRIILQGLLMVDTILSTFYDNLHTLGIFMQTIDILWMFTNNLSIWLATSLSVLYCLKIANFSHHAFLWLKWRASSVVVCILLCSVPYSFFSTVTMIVKFTVHSGLNQMQPSGNCTGNSTRMITEYYTTYILSALWTVIPFCLSLVSSFLIILSLVRHVHQMQNHATSTKDVSTRAHVRATKVILSSLFFFITYLVTFFLVMSRHLFPLSKIVEKCGSLIISAFPSIQTIALILENQKLKQTFLKMFQIKKCKLKR